MIGLWHELTGSEMVMLLATLLLQSSILAVLALLAAHLLRHRVTARYCVLFSALIALAIVPVLTFALANTGIEVVAISLPFSSTNQAMPITAPLNEAPLISVAESVPDVANDVETAHTGFHANIESDTSEVRARAEPIAASETRDGDDSKFAQVVTGVFSAVWMLGTMLALFGLVRGGWKLRRMIRRTRPIHLQDFDDVAEQVCRILNIKSLPPIISSPDVAGPMVAGILRPRIILPTRIAAELCKDELRNILLHEMAHVLRRDQLVVLLQQLITALYWPNPLVHMLNRKLARAREEICDNYVLSSVEPVEYGETLLRLGQLLPRPRSFAGTVGMFNTDWKLENRIAGLLDERRIAMTRLQPIYTATTIVLACIVSLAIAGSRIALAQGESGLVAAADAGEDDDVSRTVRSTIESLRKRPVTATTEQDRLALYAVEIETGNTTLVASEPRGNLTYIGSPSWSSDGRRILFDATPSGKDWRKSRLKLIDTSKTPATTSDLGAGNCPSLSPDGSTIAFLLNPGAVEDAQAGVWLMDADGSNRRHLGGFGCPNWSPDGRKLLIVGFTRPLPLSVMDVKSKEERAIQLAEHKVWSIPDWAGDNNTLVAVVHSTTGAGIATVDITQPEQAKVKQILWRRGDRLDVNPAFPVLSPETGRCIFVGREGKGMALYNLFINRYDPPQRLEANGYDNKIASLALSPDGRYVLFCSDRLDVRQRTVIHRKTSLRTEARHHGVQAKSMNNLKYIGLAMHNYHSAKGRFPAHSSYSEDGKPQLSWRVHLLPYLDEAALYEQFRLDESWDSPHNRKLIGKIPVAFRSLVHPELTKEGKTTFLAPYGKSFAFEGKEGMRIRDFTDGTSNTILAVEAARTTAEIWTKPGDLNVDLDAPAKGLLDAGAEGFNVLQCDGSVLYLPDSAEVKRLRAMFTRNGGEVIER